MRRAQDYVTAGAVLALALGVTACSSGGSGSPAPAGPETLAGTSASTRASSPADLAEHEAVAAYLGMWQDVADASATSDWQSPKLGNHTMGDALSVLSRQLYADHYNGLVSRGRPVNTPVVQSVDPPDIPKTVLIHDCGDDSRWLKYRVDNGQLADNEAGGRRAITAEVKLATDGTWRVTRFAVEGIGTCSP